MDTKLSVNFKILTVASVFLGLVLVGLASLRWADSGNGSLPGRKAASGASSLPVGSAAIETGSLPVGSAATETGSLPVGSGTTEERSLSDNPLPDTTNGTRLPALVSETVPFSDPARLTAKPAASDGGACYRLAEGLLDGVYQKVHVLTVDPSSDTVSVRPMLSFDRLFGYEVLTVMDARLDALASVNGGFGPPDGRPGGAVMIDGVFLSPADARFPVLIIGDLEASLSPLRTEIVLIADGVRHAADFLNPWPMTAGLAVYTPAYGSTDRLEADHLAAVVSKGLVTGIVSGGSPVSIPSDGFLAVAVGKEQMTRLRGIFPVGMQASWETDTWPELPDGSRHLMSCGSLLVHGGKGVAPESDPWAGSLAAPAPRSAVGIGREGQLVFFVAEGRIPGGASGFSGKALSRLLVDMGLAEAALLDGGASTEMIVQHEIRNQLSAGRERKLPSGFALVAR